MKKLLCTFAMFIAISFASCGNSTNTVDTVQVDTVDTVQVDTVQVDTVDSIA